MKYKYTFLLPCLNEEKSIGYCLQEINRCIKDRKMDAEILVVDNGSIDNSVNIAKKYNARVIICKEKGYGNALIYGIKNANGINCIMGDSDGSYDFYNIEKFIEKIENGYDLVIGNRFKGKILKKAMPLSHKIGVKILSIFANLIFNTPIKDYHCGIRAFNIEKIEKLDLKHSGMEFATEMIIIAKLNNLKMIEVPTILRKDLRDRKPHLRTFKDGFRHLKLIFNLAINKNKYKIEREDK